jgi:hypothetical protein
MNQIHQENGNYPLFPSHEIMYRKNGWGPDADLQGEHMIHEFLRHYFHRTGDVYL